MAYNLQDKLFDFKNMKTALTKGDSAGVVREMKDSDWYDQTGKRGRFHVSNWSREGGAQ